MAQGTSEAQHPRHPKGGMEASAKKDFTRSPLIAFYEVTRACDLVCVHCRACAQPTADPNELKTEDSKALIENLARFPDPPLLVITGGDPLKRLDIYQLIEHAVATGLVVAITPSPTPLVTAEAIQRLKAAGISRMAVSIDGADAETHDRMRGVPGSFLQTQRIMADARDQGIPLQVNTTLNPNNYGQIEAIADLLTTENVVLWSLFFIIPVGRATEELRLSPPQYEQAFERMWRISREKPFAVKTTEAMHYRRFVLQKRKEDPATGSLKLSARGWAHGLPGVNDGRGIMFISHAGLIHPSGFLPITCGMFPFNDVVDVYQNSPIFQRLRDEDHFEGKCGLCEYRHICGGSRARAYAVSGDPYGSEPDCLYLPRAWSTSGGTL